MLPNMVLFQQHKSQFHSRATHLTSESAYTLGERVENEGKQDMAVASTRPESPSLEATAVPEFSMDSLNKNPRSLELQGYNKPRGFDTQYRSRAFYNRYKLGPLKNLTQNY